MKTRRHRLAAPHLPKCDCPEGSHPVDMEVELLNTGKLTKLYERVLKHWFKTDDRAEMMKQIQRSRRVPIQCDDGTVEIVDKDTGQMLKRVAQRLSQETRRSSL